MAAENARKSEKRGIEPYRRGGMLTPFSRMEEMFEEFLSRPFSRMMWPSQKFIEAAEQAPSVDIFEEGNSIVVKSDLPGMSKEDIEVNLTDDTITLSGEKKEEEKVEKKNFYYHERAYGSFSRTFTLPAEVQSDKAKASFKNGVLEVRIPKSEEARRKEKKIKID